MIERILELMKINNINASQLTKAIGINHSSINGWKKGLAKPSHGALVKIADYFNVSIEYLEGMTDDKINKHPRGVLIPIFSMITTGAAKAMRDILGYEEISAEMAGTGRYFALRVSGDGLEPRVRDGDIVIIRRQSAVASGGTAAVMTGGAEVTLKKVKREESGEIRLYPFGGDENDGVRYTRGGGLEIIGEAIEVRGKI
ncbi:MAG: XRE family transcriptional regulator [Clostridiales bacterium]|nr:XRE family transcriptional regulator [Clostridiales bacterium]